MVGKNILDHNESKNYEILTTKKSDLNLLNYSEIENFIEGCISMDLIDFDHADIYGSYTTEADFGAVLKKRPDLRTQIRITTKCGIKMVSEKRPEHQIKSYDLNKDHIKRSVENSLLAFL